MSIIIDADIHCDGAGDGQPCADKSTTVGQLIYLPGGNINVKLPPGTVGAWSMPAQMVVQCPMCNARAFQNHRGGGIDIPGTISPKKDNGEG